MRPPIPAVSKLRVTNERRNEGQDAKPIQGLIDHMSEMNRMREYVESGGTGYEDQRLKEDELTYYTRERTFGHFRRSISLPDEVDGSRVSATFEEGLLEISIQGGANLPEPQRIQIRARPG